MVKPDTHEYVDLGLPSGALWATENIKDVNGNELYFAWGETQGYTSGQVGTDKNFTWADYEFGTNIAFTKYNNTDNLKVLEPEDDAATVNWCDGWRMPTKTDFEELIANTTSAWTEVDGVNGMLLISKANSNTLFFPAVGGAANGKAYNVGDYVYCWSVSLENNAVGNAWTLGFTFRYCGVLSGIRYYGFSVRPVRI